MTWRRLLPERWRFAKHHQDLPTREEGVERLEVHVAGICLCRTDEGWFVLAAKRQSSRQLFPEKWECGGGQVRHGEGFATALRRQFFQEFGLDVQPHYPLEVYEIPIPSRQKVIPGVRIVCETAQQQVRLNEREFSEHRWLKIPIVEELDWIGGIRGALDAVANNLGTAGILRFQVDLEATQMSTDVRDGVSKCIRRCQECDYDGAVTAICGVVDTLTERIYEARSLGNHAADSYHERVSRAVNALQAEYMKPLGALEPDEASQMWRNHRKSVGQAGYVLGAFRRHVSDVHGVQYVDPVLVQRAIDCAVFIVRSLAGLCR